MLQKDLTSDWYYNQTDPEAREIKSIMDKVYSDAITINQSFWSEADIDTRFKVGDQSLYEDYYGNLPAFRRRQFYFNKIRRVCNMITGHQRQNRNSIIAVPVEEQDQQAADQNTKLLLFAENACNEQEMISEAFDHGSITTGMSLLHYWLDFTKDPESGDIKCDHIPYNSFLIDPYFKKKDFSDCNFIWRRVWVSHQAAMRLLPGREDEIKKIHARGNRDGKFQFMAEAYNYGMKNLLSYDEYYYRAMREAKILVETNTRLTREWQGSDKDLKEFLKFYPNIIVKKTQIPTVNLAIALDGEVYYNGPQQTTSGLPFDRYPFVPFIGYYEPNLPYFPWRIQGVVRNLRDSQFLYNRRKIIELDILESQVNSGAIYKPGSLVNPQDVFLDGQGRGIAIKDGKEMTDYQRIPPPEVPQSMIQLSEILGKEIMEISGVNEELLGAATDDKAGILAKLRQGAGLTTLQVLFDQLDFSMKLCGEVKLEMIRKNYSYGKVKRILGEEPVEDYKNGVFNNFDIRIEQGVNTSTQRQMEFIQLLHLREIGVPIPAESLLKSATIQNKDELVEAIQQQEQQQSEAAQQQQQLEMLKLQAEMDLLKSQTVANEGLGIERISRVQENEALAVERIAEAESDRNQARLNYAKTLKELEDIDLSQIQKLITLATMIQQGALEVEEEKKSNPLSLLGTQNDFSNTRGIRGF